LHANAGRKSARGFARQRFHVSEVISALIARTWRNGRAVAAFSTC
jgi:hypothetical protein